MSIVLAIIIGVLIVGAEVERHYHRKAIQAYKDLDDALCEEVIALRAALYDDLQAVHENLTRPETSSQEEIK